MPRINTSSSGHAGPVKVVTRKYFPYTNAESHNLALLRRAMNIIDTRIKGHAPCDVAFKALPGGRSFADIWSDTSIWINYDPDHRPGYYGASFIKDVTIAKYAFSKGYWVVAATLIHELAHVNGAGIHDTKAEDTLKACLLKDLYDPKVIGELLCPANNLCNG